MINDASKLMNDIRTVVSTIAPDLNEIKLTYRLEEVINNYDIHRKSNEDIENDLQEKIRMYINARRIEGYSEATLKGYRVQLGMFAHFINTPVTLISTSDIRKYLASNDKWKLSTVDSKLSIIKAFFGWLVDEELLLKNPASKIKPPKQPQRTPNSLTIEELEIVRESCSNLRDKAIIEFAYTCGSRVSEIANMKINDIDFKNNSVTYIAKGNKEHTAYISERSMYHIKKYLESRNDNCEYLFVRNKRPVDYMSSDNIGKIVNKIREKSGISKPLTPHVFRKTKSMIMLANGANIEDISALLGHSSINTTLRSYARVSEERKKEAHKKYHVQ